MAFFISSPSVMTGHIATIQITTDPLKSTYDPCLKLCPLQHPCICSHLQPTADLLCVPLAYFSSILSRWVPTGTGPALPSQLFHILLPDLLSLISHLPFKAQEVGVGKEDRPLCCWATWQNPTSRHLFLSK